jgi:hypothetical protein
MAPALTRRRYPESEECWHVYYGDVHAGTIAIRTGIPHDEDPWEWHCGFYPGSQPGEHTSGTALTFEEARAGFERNGDYDAASSLHRSLQLRQTSRVGKRRIGGIFRG